MFTAHIVSKTVYESVFGVCVFNTKSAIMETYAYGIEGMVWV